MLFPTHFYTEGIPGSIIDAYAAGIPVISAKWESFDDVISEGHTGVGYSQAAYVDLISILTHCITYPADLNALKPTCLQNAHNYLPSAALQPLINKLEQ